MSVYGCFDKHRPAAGAPLLVQDGYFGTFDPAQTAAARLARWIVIPYVMSTECAYDKRTSDRDCIGCKHAKVKA
jgi:hypothetical protein